MTMTNANEALRRSDDAMKRIEALESRLWRALAQFDLLEELTIPPIDALEENLARALLRIGALEALVLTSSADVADLRIALANPSRERLDPLATRHKRPTVQCP
jgi:hypothetical protein